MRQTDWQRDKKYLPSNCPHICFVTINVILEVEYSNLRFVGINQKQKKMKEAQGWIHYMSCSECQNKFFLCKIVWKAKFSIYL